MKFLLLTILLSCCGKEEPAAVTEQLHYDIRDEPKTVCVRYYNKPKRRNGKKCKMVYIADIADIGCKCRYGRK